MKEARKLGVPWGEKKKKALLKGGGGGWGWVGVRRVGEGDWGEGLCGDGQGWGFWPEEVWGREGEVIEAG